MGLRWDDPKDRYVDCAIAFLFAGALLVVVLLLLVVWVTG